MDITPESIQELLTSDDFGQRLRAVNQMRQIDPAIAFQLIQDAVVDKNVRVRYAAVSQIATLGHQDLPTASAILLDSLMHDPEPDVQAAAADSIGALKLTDAYDALKTLYDKTPEWLVQFSIVAALGELGDPRSFELLQDALGSENELTRTAAIGSLGELGDSRAIPLLIPYATHPDWQIRYRVMQALGKFDTPEVHSTIASMVHDEMAPIAQEAQAFCDR